jgi:hypothetical protein
VFQRVQFGQAKAVAADLIDAYQRLELDHVYLLYNEFKSVIQQRVVIERLLPIERTLLSASEPALDYIYEPAPAEIFAQLLPAPRRGADLPRAARVGGRRARRSHDGDGRRDQQRERHDRAPDVVHEQGPPGRHHQGDHRGGVGAASS